MSEIVEAEPRQTRIFRQIPPCRAPAVDMPLRIESPEFATCEVGTFFKVARQSLDAGGVLVKPNTWEFVRDPDGTYSVFQRGELARQSIPERWFAEEICVRWGFCGSEFIEIIRQIELTGRATITL